MTVISCSARAALLALAMVHLTPPKENALEASCSRPYRFGASVDHASASARLITVLVSAFYKLTSNFCTWRYRAWHQSSPILSPRTNSIIKR
jgi:hypothetical protein